MKKAILSFLFFVVYFWTNQAIAQECFGGVSCMTKEIQQKCVENKENGCIDWENGIVYAVGMGVPNPKFKTQAQRNYSAYRAAQIVAKRNLLEMLQGINLTSSSTIQDGMLESDTIKTFVSGQVKNAQVVGKPIYLSDNSLWLTVRMFMKDINARLMQRQEFGQKTYGDTSSSNQNSNTPTPVTGPEPIGKKSNSSPSSNALDPDEVYTGLVIDARGTKVTPAISPRIFDERGDEVYGSAYVSRDFAVKQGMAGYAKNIDKAKQNARVQGSPIVMKAIQASGSNDSDLVIADKDASFLRTVGKTQSFLKQARVMIVLD